MCNPDNTPNEVIETWHRESMSYNIRLRDMVAEAEELRSDYHKEGLKDEELFMVGVIKYLKEIRCHLGLEEVKP